MTRDCQNENVPSAGPTLAVRYTLMEANMWAIADESGIDQLRQFTERFFEAHAGPTRLPELDFAIKQTIEAQCAADPKLTTEGIIEKCIDALNHVIGGVVEGPRRVQLAVWAAARLARHVPTTFFQKVQDMENVVRMKPELVAILEHERIGQG